MSAGVFLYFAYGSNMLSARLQVAERCPSARPLGVAELRGHELLWHKRSIKDSSGKCDIVATARPGAAVLGVLYEISEGERAALDREEGLNKGYKAIEANILFKGKQREALTYQATEMDSALRPYTWYRALVVAGAKEHGLPFDYIAHLEAVPCDQDSDKGRHQANMALIGEAR